MKEIFNSPKIEYFMEFPKDSSKRYQELCTWLNECFKEDRELVEKNNLKYLYSTIEILTLELEKMERRKNDPLKFIKLKDISYKGNEENFKEFIEEIKFEYEFLIENNYEKNNYEYLNRLFSWYKLKQEFIESAVNFLSKYELDLSKLEFEEVDLNEYKKEIFNIENY